MLFFIEWRKFFLGRNSCLSIRQFNFVLGASQESMNIHNAHSYSLLRTMCIIETEAVNW